MAIGQFVGIFRRHGKDGEVRLGWGHGVDPPPSSPPRDPVMAIFCVHRKGGKGSASGELGKV